MSIKKSSDDDSKLKHPTDLWEGHSKELLKELHILTRDGQLNRDSQRKLKQIQHLFQFIKPALETLKSRKSDDEKIEIADLGAGKSYLGFLIYDLWAVYQKNSRVWGVEARAELVAKTKELAQKFSFERMMFVENKIASASQDQNTLEQYDVVTALHACDKATDEAITFALHKNAKYIFLVPCCQAELANQLSDLAKTKDIEPLMSLWRHPIQRREFGSHLSNVIRALYLEAHGYKVRVTELVGWEHAMKNELICAERVQMGNKQAARQLHQLLEKIPVWPESLAKLPLPL